MNCLSNLYDNRNDKIKENILIKKAEYLPPKSKTFKHFKKKYFENKNKYIFDFTDRNKNSYKILIDTRRAFNHFNKNTYNEYRANINASLILTLQRPLFVISENNNLDKLIFYKSFYRKKENEKVIFHIISISVEKSENNNIDYEYKTTYEISSLSRLKRWVKLPDSLILFCEDFGGTEN